MARFNRCKMFIGGTERTDLGNYEFGDQVYSKSIKLMNTTDYVDMMPENSFSFMIKPKVGENFPDWDAILDGNIAVNVKLKDGQTRIHSKCRVVSVKETAIDGETEMGMTVNVYCESVKMV